MPLIIGENTRVKVAINAATAGVTFDGTPGSYDCHRIKSGGFKYEERYPKTPLEEALIFQRDHVLGGKILTWTNEMEWSYSYREKWLELVMGGTIGTTGASAPYTHTEDLVQQLKNGSVIVEYTDQAAQANEVFSDTFANAVVTAFSLSVEVGGSWKATISGLASERTHAENGASLTTVQETEKIPWHHVAPTIDGSAVTIASFNLDWNSPLDEAPFGMTATNPATPFGNFRSGMVALTWGAKFFADSTVLASIGTTGTLWDGENSLVSNNGGASTAEREFGLTIGDSYITGAPRTLGNPGKELIEVKLQAQHGTSPELLAAYFKNARASIT